MPTAYGRTALKATMSKYLVAVDPTLGNPYFNLVNIVTRTWTDGNGNYIPTCDFLNPLFAFAKAAPSHPS